jgi:hypothetical protein
MFVIGFYCVSFSLLRVLTILQNVLQVKHIVIVLSCNLIALHLSPIWSPEDEM